MSQDTKIIELLEQLLLNQVRMQDVLEEIQERLDELDIDTGGGWQTLDIGG